MKINEKIIFEKSIIVAFSIYFVVWIASTIWLIMSIFGVR